MNKDSYNKINSNRKYCNEDIYDEVSEELKVNINLVKEVVSANSEYTVSIIHQGAFESVIYPYLGKIKAKLRSIQRASGNVNRP